MQPPHQHQRINLAELKAQIVKQLGPEGSKQYFYYLNRFLSLKLSKAEFNKLCVRIVGRENIPLHNQFIHSILKNACTAKVPPLTHDKEVLKPVRVVGSGELPSDGPQQNVPNLSVLSNGHVSPLSSQKFREAIRDRKVLDHPNGKTSFVTHQSFTERDSSSNVVLENGDLTLHDIQRPLQHHQGLKEQAKDHVSANLPSIQKFPDGSVSVHSNNQIETVAFEHGKGVSARSLLSAPLGVPSCPVSIGGACKMMPLASSSKCATSFSSSGLLDPETLKERMEQIAATQGLEGISTDCASLLNKGLDAYLKRLIASCSELVGARSGHEPMKSSTLKHHTHLKVVNGVALNHHHIQSSSRPVEGMQERRPHFPLSLIDFRVAMELNPQQLGDWPLLLEKIRARAFEE